MELNKFKNGQVRNQKGQQMTDKRSTILINKFKTKEAVSEYMASLGSKGGKSNRGNAHKKGFGTKPYIRKRLT